MQGQSGLTGRLPRLVEKSTGQGALVGPEAGKTAATAFGQP